jgi:hypothetical protein
MSLVSPITTPMPWSMTHRRPTLAPEYKFQIWALDEPDQFRIKIWTEDETGVETINYDNGSHQVLGGGSIVIHTK